MPDPRSPDTPEQGVQDVDAIASNWDAFKGGRLWPLAVGLLGGSVWAQLFLLGLIAEGQFASPRPIALLAYLLPLGILAVGIWSRASVLLLAVFMVGCMPGVVLLPGPERLLLLEGTSLVRIGLNVALYLAIASAGSGEESGEVVAFEHHEAQARGDEGTPIWSLQRFVWSRIGILLVLFALPAYAIFEDPAVTQALNRNYGGAPEVAQTFLGLVHLFVWSVAAYMMVFVPSLNIEYDHRRLLRTLRQTYQDATRRRIGIRIAAWSVGTGILAALIWLTTL